MTLPPPAAVASVELRRVRLRLRHAHVAAHGAEHARAVVLARITTVDGVDGWGEGAALAVAGYTAEDHAGSWAALHDDLGPALLAGDGSATVDPLRPMATAALADAVLDARLRAAGTALADWLGATRAAVPSVTVVGRQPSIDDLLERLAAVHGGVKLKIEPGHDRDPLAAVRATGAERWLAADANGSYPSPGAVPDLGDLGLAYLEQPCGGLADAVAAAGAARTRVALDESLAGIADAEAALASAPGPGPVLNVKPARLGGIEPAAALVRWAEAHGVDAFVGGMLETGVGRAGALAVAAMAGCTLPTDLGPSDRYWAADVTGAIGVDGSGAVVVPHGPGIGVAVDPDRLDATTVERLVLRR